MQQQDGVQAPGQEDARTIKGLIVETVSDWPLRCALFMLLLAAAGGVPLVEQPQSSLLMHHERMQWALKALRSRGVFASCLNAKLV